MHATTGLSHGAVAVNLHRAPAGLSSQDAAAVRQLLATASAPSAMWDTNVRVYSELELKGPVERLLFYTGAERRCWNALIWHMMELDPVNHLAHDSDIFRPHPCRPSHIPMTDLRRPKDGYAR